MEWFNTATVFFVLTLVGVEFSVSAFVNPAAWRLEPKAHLKLLGHSGSVLGRVMPVWYSTCALMLGIQTWLHWHAPGCGLLLAADGIWALTFLISIFVLVPMNNRMIEGVADWQRIHRTWDKIHRVRIAGIAVAAILLTRVLVRNS